MVDAASNDRSLIGERISVIGGSCSGKSTFAEHLAGLIDGTYVELDALYWLLTGKVGRLTSSARTSPPSSKALPAGP